MRRRPVTALLRVLEYAAGRGPVVELTSPAKGNPLYDAYCALRRVGVQVVHAAVHRHGDRMVQRLALRETDGTELSQVRLMQSLATLKSACAVSRVRHGTLASTQGWAPGALEMGA